MKLWHITQDPVCKMAVNWVSKTIRQMTCRKTLEWWETQVRNCEVTPQAPWPVTEWLMKRDGPKAPTTVHGPLGITYHPNEKANVITVCFENQFTFREVCDGNHEGWVETKVQALATSVVGFPLGKVRPCDKHKLVNLFQLRKACGLDGIPDECLRHLQRRPLVHLTHIYYITAFSCPIFQSPGRKQVTKMW
jgi:hypothetical protein